MRLIVIVALLSCLGCDQLTGPTPPPQPGAVSGFIRLSTGETRTITVIVTTTDTVSVEIADSRIYSYSLPASGDSIRVWAECAGERKRMVWYRGGGMEDGQSFLLYYNDSLLIPMRVVGY